MQGCLRQLADEVITENRRLTIRTFQVDLPEVSTSPLFVMFLPVGSWEGVLIIQFKPINYDFRRANLQIFLYYHYYALEYDFDGIIQEQSKKNQKNKRLSPDDAIVSFSHSRRSLQAPPPAPRCFAMQQVLNNRLPLLLPLTIRIISSLSSCCVVHAIYSWGFKFTGED